MILSVGIWILLAGSVKAEDAARNVTVEQLRSQAPLAWQKLREGLLEGFKVEVKITRGAPAAGSAGVDVNVSEGLQYTRILCAVAANELIQTRYLRGKRQGESVSVVNKRYGFDLSRKQGGDDRWLLTNLHGDPAAAKNGRSGMLSANSLVFDGIRVEGEWLEALLKSPNFQVVSNENVSDDDGGRQFKVEFRSNHVVDPISMPDAIVGGTLWLSPDRYWVLNRYDVRIQSGTTQATGRASSELTYQELDKYPFPKNVVLDYKFDGDAPLRTSYEFGDVSRCTDDASAFSLTAFGLPELATSDANAPIAAYKWWLVVCAVGVVLCITAIVLRSYATRQE